MEMKGTNWLESDRPDMFVAETLEKVGLIDEWGWKLKNILDGCKENYLKSKQFDAKKISREIGEELRAEFKEIYYAANDKEPIMIIGETGTGKELMADAVHVLSGRKGELKKINCAAIPETLLASELFGHEKDAFTGAIQKKDGIIRMAEGGTLFLDEIGKMSKDTQPHFLRAIDKKEVVRLGSHKVDKIDVRIIAAVQPQDLKGLLPDLYCRFQERIEISTLRDKLIAMPEIIESRLMAVLRRKGLKENDLPFEDKQSAVDLLKSYDYKVGNYRELETVLMSAINIARSHSRKTISDEDLNKAMEKNNRINSYLPEDQGENIDRQRNYLAEFMRKPANVKLSGIMDHANKMRALIIEEKINSVIKSGKSIKSVLLGEGLSEKDYQNFRKKVVLITGKNLKEFGN